IVTNWIAAGIRGLSTGLTMWAATGLGGGDNDTTQYKPAPPTEGTQSKFQPLGDMEFLPDGAAPIFDQIPGFPDIDFGSGVMSNILNGPNMRSQVNSIGNLERLAWDSSILDNFDLNKVIPDWGEVFEGPVGDVLNQAVGNGLDMNGLVPGIFLKPDNPGTGLIQQILPFVQQGVVNNLVENEAIPPNAYQVGDWVGD
ncbi:MAG: hypothetical protein ACO3PR_06105, partial [Limisphaerales bacterium]